MNLRFRLPTQYRSIRDTVFQMLKIQIECWLSVIAASLLKSKNPPENHLQRVQDESMIVLHWLDCYRVQRPWLFLHDLQLRGAIGSSLH